MGAMHILVTGFEPFGTDDFNASGAVVSALPANVAGRRLSTAILPVSFDRSGETLCALLVEHRPDALICLGEAGGRAAITPEALAVNEDHARIPDNDGAQPRAEAIISDGPLSLPSGLDAQRITALLAAAGFAAQVSEDAGSFVCNHVAYLAYAQPVPALFIHVPALRPDGREPGVGRETDPRLASPATHDANGDFRQLCAAVELVVANL